MILLSESEVYKISVEEQITKSPRRLDRTFTAELAVPFAYECWISEYNKILYINLQNFILR